MLFNLEGMVALITGASGAIGRAISVKIAAQGAEVIISGTKEDALANLSDEIYNLSGKKAYILKCDLSNIQETNDLFNKSEAIFGKIDILINNAGINKDMLLMKMGIDDFEEVLNINLKSSFILSKNAVLSMGKKNFGRVINMSSVVGFVGNPGQVNYCASKSALLGMSKSIAIEYAKKGITVNCIAPGAISSPMLDKLSEAAMEKFVSKIPMGYIGTPEDVAHACCFLASREAAYITGQTIHVNGGMLMV